MTLTEFEDIFFNRRSIRAYDPTVKISQAELATILTEATRAPSSRNLQPWRFVVAYSPEAKETIKPLLNNNIRQAETAAAIIFIFGDLHPLEQLPTIMQGAVDLGTMSPAESSERQQQMTDYYATAAPNNARETALLDGGLIAMSLMLLARKHGYDTCPIGGYDKENITAALGLDTQRYFPIVALSIGKAQDEGFESYRLPVETITEWR